MIRWLCLMVLGVSLSGCGRLLFFPQAELVRTPGDVGLAWRDVHIRSADGTPLHAWWLEAAAADGSPPRGTVYFLHGNAENISTHLASVHWLPAAGYQVLLLDYRGFGRSAGEPRLPGVVEDVQAGFRWLAAEPQAQDLPLFLLGQSIGAALGAQVAGTDGEARAQLAGVVLDSGIARFGWIAREVAAKGWLTWPLQWPIAWTMPRGYDPLDAVAAIAPLPVMILHGRNDAIVPFRHGEALDAAAGEPKTFVPYDGPHIGAFLYPSVRSRLLEFFAEAPRRADISPTSGPGSSPSERPSR